MSVEDFNNRMAHSQMHEKQRRKLLHQAARRAKEKIKGEGRCRNDNCSSGRPPEWHHIVPRSRFGTYDLDKHSLDNSIPLCRECHSGWHDGMPLPRRILSASEVSFILKHAGEGFLDRHYPEG